LPLYHLSVFAAVFLLSSCSGEPPETLFTVTYDESDMDTAMENARQHVNVFVSALKEKQGESYSVKVAVSDDENTE